MVIVNRPSSILGANEERSAEKVNKIYDENGILWCRIFLIVISIGLLLFANLKAGNPLLYSVSGSSAAPMEGNLLDGSTVVRQNLNFDSLYELEELTLYFANDGYVKDNFGSAWVKIINTESKELLFAERIGASMVQPGAPYRISLKGLDVTSGKQYALLLEGVSGMEGSNYFFSPWITDKIINENAVFVNGEPQNYSLYMEIR